MKSINEKAPVICRKTILIEAKPERIWNVLSDIERWPSWHDDINYAKLHGELQTGTAFTWKSKGMKINSIIHTAAPFYQLGWSGRALGTFAIHNWVLKAVEAGTEVTVSESMEGLLTILFKSKLQSTLDSGMDKWLNRLKVESERGEINELIG